MKFLSKYCFLKVHTIVLLFKFQFIERKTKEMGRKDKNSVRERRKTKGGKEKTRDKEEKCNGGKGGWRDMRETVRDVGEKLEEGRRRSKIIMMCLIYTQRFSSGFASHSVLHNAFSS